MNSRIMTSARNQYFISLFNVFDQEWVIAIVHFFSSVAHVWVLGAKTTGPIEKKFGFS
jgi:hypothetical protein